MTTAVLTCHGSSRPPVPLRLEAAVELVAGAALHLRYELHGDLAHVRLPPARHGVRTDGLWRHTCFEAFIRTAACPAYVELNFSPSTCWAFYAFDGYREGMRAAAVDPPLAVQVHGGEGSLVVSAQLPLAPLLVALGEALGDGTRAASGSAVSAADAAALPVPRLLLALSAVLEHRDSQHSYWALAHPPGKPDFHHHAGFVMNLEGMIP